MPVTNDGFRKYKEEEIFNRLKSDLEERLGVKANPGSLVRKQLEAEAKTLAEYQEESLKQVYRSAYLQDATGKELDKLVDLIGISRNEATTSSGIATFSRDNIPNTDYTIPRNIQVQTDEVTPVEFVTTEKSGLFFIDDFTSDLSSWDGDTDQVSLINSTEFDNQALELPATAGTSIQTVDSYDIGTTFEVNTYLNTDSVISFQFAYQDSQNYLEAVVDPGSNGVSIKKIKDGTETESNSKNVTFDANQRIHAVVDWYINTDSQLTIYKGTSKNEKIASISINESNDWLSGSFGLASQSDLNTSLVNKLGTTTSAVNIESVDSGSRVNVPANSITIITNGLTGVDRVNNPFPVGNDNYIDTDAVKFRYAVDEETDDELRERAYDNTSIGGAATYDAIATAISEIESVENVKLKRNRESSTVDGLPPHSFEPIVYGGTNEEIAEAIFDAMSIDSNDVGGVNGVSESYNVYSEVTDSKEQINWSRPENLALNITLDLIVDENYVGDIEIQSIIANYIGGTDVDGTKITGINVGENLYEAVLKNEIIDPKNTGVWEVDSLKIDSNGDSTDDTIETTSGADILEVSDGQVATVNARDGSITINTTQK